MAAKSRVPSLLDSDVAVATERYHRDENLTPDISVVIPVFNQESLIAGCIWSGNRSQFRYRDYCR